MSEEMKQSPESGDGDMAAGQSIDQMIDGSSSALAERLLRRATEPVGMIDSRHPRNLRARTSGWLAQRFGLLDHWRTRYAVADSRADGESLVFKIATTRSFGETAEGLNDAAPIARVAASSAPPLKVSGVGSNDASPSTPSLRVSRRAARQAPPPGVTIVQTKAEGTGGRREIARSSEDKTEMTSGPSPMRSQNVSGESLVVETTPAPVLSLQPLITSEAEGGLLTPKSASPLAGQVVSEDTKTAGYSQPSSFRQRLETVTISRGGEITPPLVAQTAGRAPWPVAGQTSAQRGGAVAEIIRANTGAAPQWNVEAPGGPVRAVAAEAAKPVAPTPLALRLIQRQPAKTRVGREISGEAASTRQALSPVAKEISASTSQTANARVIWSKAASGEKSSRVSGISAVSPLPLKMESSPNRQVIARQLESGSGSNINSPLSINETDVTAPDAERNVDMDLPRLAEQVSRILARQLAAERERRGMN